MKPPEQMTVSQWADANRVLDAKSSNEPGRWKTDRTPYLRGIMDAFTDPDVDEIVFVKPTQVGGTECILNILGYIVDQDAAPVLVLYPADNIAEHVSKNRIQPMIKASKVLAERFDEKGSKLLELQTTGMFIALSGANTASQLSSKPIRFLLLDEVDKYPPRAGKEANPIALARERTKTFAYNRKIFTTSTPTYKTGAVWEEYESCEAKYQYHVPCPHCGTYQTLEWKHVKFDSTLERNSDRADTAHYLCPHCEEGIVDADKPDMLAAGRWVAEKEGSRRKVGFHLNAIYSPWVTFRDVVAEFLKSKGTPETLMNFVNSWLAQPFEQVSSSADVNRILDRQGRYTRGVVPDETLRITGGVDKQRDCFYYTIRAWGENRRSWNMDHGKVRTEEELVEVFDRPFCNEHGQEYYIDLVLIDSGDDTDVVYDFCYLHQGLFAPVKGSSRDILGRWRPSTIEKQGSRANGMQLVLCDGGQYKDMIFRRINSKKADWFVYDGCDEEYARQMSSEHKVAERVAGRTVFLWKPKASRADNHYLDCEVYATCAADVMGQFDLVVAEEEQRERAAPEPPAAEQGGGWLEGVDDWL